MFKLKPRPFVEVTSTEYHPAATDRYIKYVGDRPGRLILGARKQEKLLLVNSSAHLWEISSEQHMSGYYKLVLKPQQRLLLVRSDLGWALP
jgi:hypothetical protein